MLLTGSYALLLAAEQMTEDIMRKALAVVLLNWFLFYWGGYHTGWVILTSYLNKGDCVRAVKAFQAKRFSARCVEIKLN